MRDSLLETLSGRHRPHRQDCTVEGNSSILTVIYVLSSFGECMQHKKGGNVPHDPNLTVHM